MSLTLSQSRPEILLRHPVTPRHTCVPGLRPPPTTLVGMRLDGVVGIHSLPLRTGTVRGGSPTPDIPTSGVRLRQWEVSTPRPSYRRICTSWGTPERCHGETSDTTCQPWTATGATFSPGNSSTSRDWDRVLRHRGCGTGRRPSRWCGSPDTSRDPPITLDPRRHTTSPQHIQGTNPHPVPRCTVRPPHRPRPDPVLYETEGHQSTAVPTSSPLHRGMWFETTFPKT